MTSQEPAEYSIKAKSWKSIFDQSQLSHEAEKSKAKFFALFKLCLRV